MSKAEHVEIPFWTEYILNNMEKTKSFLQEVSDGRDSTKY